MKIKSIQIRSFAIDGVDKAQADNSSFIGMSLSSETPVSRNFGNEILLHGPNNIDFSRALPNGLPLLISHDSSKLPIGRLKNVILDPETKKLRGEAYFSGRQEAQLVRQDILDGVLTDVSIGYKIKDYTVDKGSKGEPDTVNVTRWMPLEGSMVAIGADGSVGVGRSEELDLDLDLEQERAAVKKADPTVEDAESSYTDPSKLEDSVTSTLEENEEAAETPIEAAVEALAESVEEANEPLAEAEAETPADEAEEEDKVDPTDKNKRDYDLSNSDEVIALRNVALNLNIKSELEIDEILKNTQDIDSARSQILKPTPSIYLQKENKMEFNKLLYRGLANAIKGKFDAVDEKLAGVIARNGERGFTADLFATRADTWSGDTVASNMTTAQSGAAAVYAQNIGLLDILRARTVCLAAGAKTRSGSGSLSYLRQSAVTTVVAKGEDTGVPANSNIDFVKVPYTPHALVATVYLTDELQKESIVDLQNALRGDMVKQFALKLDNMGINGVTGAYTVNGLLSAASSIQNGNLGASGVPTFKNVNNLKALVDQYNVDLESSSFITTPGLMALLETTAKFTGGAGFPIADANKINGYKALTSTNVPIASSQHTLIFGDFSNLEFALMGPMEFMVDIQTRFSEGITIVTARQYVDVGVLQPNAFAACQNFTLS